MTRETKIGLLVGLAFVIVIGILLSDHFRGMEEPPPAMLDRAGANVRQAIVSPGADQPQAPIVVAPQQINPSGTVPTPTDIEPQPSPVVVANPPAQQQFGPTPIQASPLSDSDALQQAARQQGQELVQADGQPLSAGASSSGTYRAVAGDTLSRMAAKLLGANTYKNRQAIINANPSLRDDPNMIEIGRSYNIPGSAAGSSVSTASAEMAAATMGKGPSHTAGGQWIYTVKPGDTLWGIATGMFNNPAAVDQIRALNRTTLRGGSTIQVGMQLRLPSAPVTVADSVQ